MKKIINVSNAPKPIAPYSQATLSNGTLYVSGQIGINPADGKLVEGGIKAQTKQIMENIGMILKEAGLDYSDVVKCTIFMTDMFFYTDINEVYGTFFKENPPAREAVAVKSLPANVQVEISCIATE
ncbi:MAG: reactive intermediate/imine deaminase [Bacteroidetes bacterium HGW-Bacteroidetes-17]|jgi:2-iminobutanoate/2-iminopropanoate deaminase|nr:MAG: reactive intermediate/imine deaminase [Bacteroidetes bacterium HGW-Bacteroidetes-17]